MSVLLAGTVASAYVATVLGLHRLNVVRLRRASGGFPVLERLDWQSLLRTVLGSEGGPDEARADVPATLPDGGAVPPVLRQPVPEAERRRREVLLALIGGAPADAILAELAPAGFSGGEVGWLSTLALVGTRPLEALERLEGSQPTSAEELYLREHLRLRHRTNLLNLELSVFGAKRRLSLGLTRFGEQPCLFLGRALASSRVGMNNAAIDDLARAVYFSDGAPFYVDAVLQTPFLAEARPALVFQCRQVGAAAPSDSCHSG